MMFLLRKNVEGRERGLAATRWKTKGLSANLKMLNFFFFLDLKKPVQTSIMLIGINDF